MLLHDTVYLGANNTIALSLQLERITITHVTDITDDIEQNSHKHPVIKRCQLNVEKIIDDPNDADVIVDSDTYPERFDFISDPKVLVISLGSSALKIGRHKTKIKIYEENTPLGYHFGEIVLVVQ